MPNALARTIYTDLLDDIAALYEDAREGQVRFAWETGRRIVEVEQQGEVRAGYGSGLIRSLSADLTARYGAGSGFSETNLKVMRQLYRMNPGGLKKSPQADLLSWSDQRELLPVKDAKARQRLVKRIAGKGLKRDELRELIRRETGADGSKLPAKPLAPLARPAPEGLLLGTLRAAKPEVTSLRKVSRDEILVDCGFFVYRAVAKGDLEGRLTGTPSYTYCATVERVVDGDTLVVLIDTGFGNILEEKLRLRGVNTPELGTPEGEKAKKFVEKLLPAGTVIVLKSQKSTDPHGRFVVDIFYLHPTGEGGGPEIIESGEYLNQVLLDKGYAVRMKE